MAMNNFPNKKYKTIYADPPWPEYGGGKIKRGADRHYDLMTVKDIIAQVESTFISWRKIQKKDYAATLRNVGVQRKFPQAGSRRKWRDFDGR